MNKSYTPFKQKYAHTIVYALSSKMIWAVDEFCVMSWSKLLLDKKYCNIILFTSAFQNIEGHVTIKWINRTQCEIDNNNNVEV